ncbi:MAG: hypothetical protein R2860_01790 [Desulfobacterales bacterium]
MNWCDPCQTVLANEQVEAGACWRCGKPVRQKKLSQWFSKSRIMPGFAGFLRPVAGVARQVTTMQKNWIGKSTGAEIHFAVEDSDQTITVFTTRHDTVLGATFMCLAPEHPMVEILSRNTSQAQTIVDFQERMAAENRSSQTIETMKGRGVHRCLLH